MCCNWKAKKEWRVYKPRTEDEVLPKFSSGNFTQEEIGEEVLRTTLEAGDILYFPRGFIHQARSLPDAHSLHITISTYQCNTWHDVMKEMMNEALETAMKNDVEFRRGVPLNFLNCCGSQNSEQGPSAERQAVTNKIADLFTRLRHHADIDLAADRRAVSFLHDSLPPVLSKEERSRMIFGSKVNFDKRGQPQLFTSSFTLDTKVRLIRKNAIRIIADDDDGEDGVRVYYNYENPTVYHAEEKKHMLVEVDKIGGVDCLIESYPKYVKIGDLPLDEDESKFGIAHDLFERGLLMTDKKMELSKFVAED